MAIVERTMYQDFSAFTQVGTDFVPRGGASRASEKPVVNIQGGGGLSPVIRADVMRALLAPES